MPPRGAIDRATRKATRAQGRRRARRAAHAGRQGVLHRYRHRGRLARRAGAWRHGLHRGDRRGAASARCAHRGDLRRHQRHPGDRSRDAQAAADPAARSCAPISTSCAPPSTAVQAANDPAFGATGARLAEAVDSLDRATTWLLSKVEKEPQTALAGATPYLRLFGNAAGGCMLADEALAALRVADGEPAARVAIARFFAENIAVQASGPGAHRHRRRRQRQRRRSRADGMSDHVTVADDGAVRTVRMNRPDKKNALTAAMYAAMAAALEDANSHAAIRCIVIAGAPGAFSAGNDLVEFSQAADLRRGPRRAGGALSSRARAIRAAARRRRARPRGRRRHHHAAALRLRGRGRRRALLDAVRQSRLVPEAASSLLAPRLMGHRRAFELLVMGRPLDAAAAQGLRAGQHRRRAGRGRGGGHEGRPHIAALPAEAVAASRRLMRGSPDEIVRASTRRCACSRSDCSRRRRKRPSRRSCTRKR